MTPFALFALIFLSVMGAYLASFALFAAIFVFSMSAKIFQIFRFSVFGVHILITFFHFYIKQKNLNIFFKIFSKPKISDFSEISHF